MTLQDAVLPTPPPVVRQKAFAASECALKPPFIERLEMPPLPDCLLCDEKPLYNSTNDAIRDIAISLFGAFVLGAATAFAISHYSRRVSDT
jgi:hypothetical protein